MLTGAASAVHDLERIAWFVGATNAKYDTDYDLSFFDPAVNGTFVLRPEMAIGLVQEDFAGSPTRWRFDAS